MRNKLPVILIVLLLGCSAKQAPLPDANLKAIDLNQRAGMAFRDGNYANAVALYSGALRVNRSIENADGIAIDLINISAVYRKMGDGEKAERAIEEILNSNTPGFGDGHLSEAAFMKALLRLDAGAVSEAEDWAKKSLSYCEKAKCGKDGRIYNLMARISLKKADYPAAVSQADKGLKLNKEHEDSEEAANSIRLMAEAKFLSGNHAEALRLYEDALSMDKSLALSGKIALDLMGAGNSLCEMGKNEEALSYFQRALEVSKSGGNDPLAAQAVEMVRKCVVKRLKK